MEIYLLFIIVATGLLREGSCDETIVGLIINGHGNEKFEIGYYLGNGSYGDVHIGKNIDTGEIVAIKTEKKSSARAIGNVLNNEIRIYRENLKSGSGLDIVQHKRIAHIHFGGELKQRSQPTHNVMVMDYVGPSVEDLFRKTMNKQFSDQTIYRLAIEMLYAAEQVHNSGLVHLDMKPDNFLVGGLYEDEVIAIDFGCSKQITEAGESRTKKPKLDTVYGTPMFMSRRIHLFRIPGRKDDLETIGYILAYFYNKGDLPWSSLNETMTGSKGERDEKAILDDIGVMKIKLMKDPNQICKNAEIIAYLKAVRKSGFKYSDKKVNYADFRKIFEEKLLKPIQEYDWNLKTKNSVAFLSGETLVSPPGVCSNVRIIQNKARRPGFPMEYKLEINVETKENIGKLLAAPDLNIALFNGEKSINLKKNPKDVKNYISLGNLCHIQPAELTKPNIFIVSYDSTPQQLVRVRFLAKNVKRTQVGTGREIIMQGSNMILHYKDKIPVRLEIIVSNLAPIARGNTKTSTFQKVTDFGGWIKELDESGGYQIAIDNGYKWEKYNVKNGILGSYIMEYDIELSKEPVAPDAESSSQAPVLPVQDIALADSGVVDYDEFFGGSSYDSGGYGLSASDQEVGDEGEV